MSQTLDYIESYFTRPLSAEEKKSFESRCETDEVFAKEVAFYIAARSAMHHELLQQKQQLWHGPADTNAKPRSKGIVKKTYFKKWMAYAAAACIILLLGIYLFAPASPEQLANNYIQKKYSQLSLTMDGSNDSLQLGINAYKAKDYSQALRLFQYVQRRQPDNSDAIEYTGLVYLMTKQYDQALQQFTTLSSIPGLYSNAGDFLKAVTYLQRGAHGDKETARQLLLVVVKNNEEESEEAKKLLEKW